MGGQFDGIVEYSSAVEAGASPGDIPAMPHAPITRTMPVPFDAYVAQLRALVERAVPALLALPESEVVRRPAPEKWSPQEILGHLVDSAANNHQRFVRAQSQEDLVFPGYAQDEWVGVQRYREAEWTSLVTLWWMYNTHLTRVMRATPEDERLRPRPHNLDEIAWRTASATIPATLDYLMRDYGAHLRHHLAQILPPEALGTPPQAD